MNMFHLCAAGAALLFGGVATTVSATPFQEALDRIQPYTQLAQARRTCQDMRSCREAVILWCEGYTRADGDGDGIPCENVCSTRAEVEDIQAEIGC